MSGMNLVPPRSLTPPPSRRQLALQALLATLALLIGVFWACRLDVGAGGGRAAATLAALMIISGLCGAIVTLIQCLAGRR
jgi:hypothetical protein